MNMIYHASKLQSQKLLDEDEMRPSSTSLVKLENEKDKTAAKITEIKRKGLLNCNMHCRLDRTIPSFPDFHCKLLCPKRNRTTPNVTLHAIFHKKEKDRSSAECNL